jgi:hypothetical protein
VVTRVVSDHVWGGYSFEGQLLRPGSSHPIEEIPEPGVLLECAGPVGSGWGHRRRDVLYILWRFDRRRCEWREIARALAVTRDWTLDLGPIAQRELSSPRPVLIDPALAAGRVMAALAGEIELVDRQAQRLILLAVYDRVAGSLAAAL